MAALLAKLGITGLSKIGIAAIGSLFAGGVTYFRQTKAAQATQRAAHVQSLCAIFICFITLFAFMFPEALPTVGTYVASFFRTICHWIYCLFHGAWFLVSWCLITIWDLVSGSFAWLWNHGSDIIDTILIMIFYLVESAWDLLIWCIRTVWYLVTTPIIWIWYVI